ncbi:MAG: hypothetical protein MUF58_00690 [Arcicella sp.]|jgi:hypothetical protein|nr:hypothetical protein [Arcicella sp.]
MKAKITIFGILLWAFTGCVQKTTTQTVVYKLSIKNIKDIKTVGVRGNNKPLSWQSDYPMTFDRQDSTYKATVTYITGYKFTEVKFVVNDEFELADQDNRKVNFSDKDTTIYTATFNVKNNY